MSDFRSFHRPEAGSHTVEGNVAGARAAQLERKRQAEQEQFELEKLKRQRHTNAENGGVSLDIGSKFQTARIGSTMEEQTFQRKTIGLVSAQDFLQYSKEQKEKQNDKKNDDDNDDDDDDKKQQKALEMEKEKQKKLKKSKKKKKEKKQMASRLSFMDDDQEEDENDNGDHVDKDKTAEKSKKVTNKKDPTVDTSFLPDKEREEQLAKERKRLQKEWQERQERIKKEPLEITYSYWDGSGHRRVCTTTKGALIGDFLETVRQDLCSEFKELINVGADALMYVKEDLILPQDISFYDLIVTKARGKSGPLFHFDVHEDVRLGPLDRRIEKDESHPGKVVERRWYERNKHIFPASRWELYDPAKNYGAYTIHDTRSKGK